MLLCVMASFRDQGGPSEAADFLAGISCPQQASSKSGVDLGHRARPLPVAGGACHLITLRAVACKDVWCNEEDIAA